MAAHSWADKKHGRATALECKKKENQKPESSRVSKSQLLELPRLLSKIAVTGHTLSEKVCHELLETS